MQINLDDLIAIFQLNDPSIYSVADEELSASQWDLVLRGWKKLSPQEGGFFTDYESPQNVQAMYANGQNISILVSKCRINNENIISLSVFCELPSDEKGVEDGQLKLIPAFSLTGQLDEDGNINVIEAHARLPDTDNSILTLGAENQQDVMGFMVYANDCFISMIKDKVISLEDLAPALSETQLANAKQVYDRLCTRTKFDTHCLRKNKVPDNTPYTLPLASMDNIFLLESTGIYYEVEDENKPEVTRQIKDALGQVKSDYSLLITDERNFKYQEILFLQDENGNSFWSIAFEADDFFGIPQDYHLFVLFKSFVNSLPDKQDEMMVIPISIILGQVNQLKDTFEPLEAHCAIPSDTNDSLRIISLTTTAGFVGTLCLTEQGINAVFSGNEMNINELSHWLESSEYNKMLQRYQFLLYRSQGGFLRAIDDERLTMSDRNSEEAVLLDSPSSTAFFIGGPPTPQ